MRAIYSWTEWFSELAEKVATGGEEFLIDRAKQIEWKADGTEPPSWMSYGDENIDPFSFIYSVGRLGSSKEERKKVFPSITDFFEINAPLSIDCDDAFLFPRPRPLFCHDGEGNPKLLWRLFSQAVSGFKDVVGKDFDEALEIPGVRTPKLTEALFLINPWEFLPYNNISTKSLGIFSSERNINWIQYQKELQKFTDVFPNCELPEINLIAFLYYKRDLIIGDKYFQVSTNADGPNGGDFWQDLDPERDFEPNNWVLTGGPKSGVSWEDYQPRDGDHPEYPVDHPQPGDVILVRTGMSRGRGIGVVYKNDYKDHLDKNSRIHVVWVNKAACDNLQLARQWGFRGARKDTTDAFRNTPTYKATFDLLDRLRKHMPKTPKTKHPLNQILYGPPGTGKTYHTVDRALAIIDGEKVREREEGDIGRFRELRDSGQIAMVTFHQNFAYEDFIEGIRPVLDSEDGLMLKIPREVFGGPWMYLRPPDLIHSERLSLQDHGRS